MVKRNFEPVFNTAANESPILGFYMVKELEDKKMRTIHTTIGDLICAIADAATEAEIGDEDLSRLTHEVLMKLLNDRVAA